jgi:monoamine oxidase
MLDVLVIGAGLAGLRTASLLKARGLTVRVLEARDRVGGRTQRHALERGWVDLGGQWLGADQRRLRALSEELGLETFRTYDRGRKRIEVAGRVRDYEGTIPALPVLSLLQLELTLRRTRRALEPIVQGQPWTSPEAERLDRRSLDDWLRQTLPLGSPGREVFDLAMRVVFGAEASELSLLHVLHYAKAAGGLMPLVETEGGAQQERYVEGAGVICERLAPGLDLRLSQPVLRIEQDDTGVVVHTRRGSHAARRCVVTVPPPLAARIAYSPPLPPARDQLCQRMPMGATIKCMAFYERAWWRDRGLSGEAISDRGPACFVVDNSDPGLEHPALLGFIVGETARTWGQRSAEERRAAVLECFARLLGPEARQPIDWIEKDWSQEEWTRGCPIANMSPGTLSSYGHALREPVGRIHWAGTETAREWGGFLEGALESAERVADELAGAL